MELAEESYSGGYNTFSYGYTRPFTRLSLRNVRTSLYKLSHVVKPYRLSFNTGNAAITGTWHRAMYNYPGAVHFSFEPYKYMVFDNPHRDHWYVSLSFWLHAFNTGLYFNSAQNAGSGAPSVFTSAMQAAALTDGTLNFYVKNAQKSGANWTISGTNWSSVVDNSTVLMTLTQSLDTLLELPELRIVIKSGGASVQPVDTVIKGGSALLDPAQKKLKEWLKERKEIRRIKRKVRNSVVNTSFFDVNFNLMSYKITPEQPKLSPNYLKQLIKTKKSGFKYE